MRKPFQGIANIVRFNWHFYVLSFGALGIVMGTSRYIDNDFHLYINIVCFLIFCTTVISLSVSYYVYDLSGLYKFSWLEEFVKDGAKTVNINAGFDETTEVLKTKFSHADFTVLDFYEPQKHTEVSIRRARKAYPPFPDTKRVKTSLLPLADRSVDNLFVIFSAHEIRDINERISFFKELNRVIKPTGQIFIIEHLRDFNNFLAYNIGFLHFYSRSTWLTTFDAAYLKIHNEVKFTPFISTFLLKPNGDTY